MCGIAALYSQAAPVAESALREALAAMRHRGPDGSGIWLSPDCETALGHTRLSVIDLRTGAQPLASEDGRVAAAVNGEFYDFERIREELEGRGHRFRTRSDSEVLVHLYEDHGLDCLRHLRGEFAFVLWDGRNRRLFAARDRFGIKPLCYSLADGVLRLASEAKALFAAGARAAWDREAFFQAAHVQYTPPDRTLFAGIRQLPPGHYLVAERGGVRTACYWDLDYPVDVPARHPAAPELAAELRDRLDEAVRLRLRADVPVAFHLSGGLDSSSVLALAARGGGRPLDCFSVQFEWEPYDERAVAEEMARHVGAVFHPVPVTQADLLECLPDAVCHGEGLAINGHLTAKFLLSRAIRAVGYKVVLTGEGSDEVFAGYAHLRRDLLDPDGPGQEQIEQLAAANAVSAGIMLPQGESLPLEALRERLGFVPAFLEAKGTLGFRMREVLSEEFVAEFSRRDPFARFLEAFDLPGQLAGRHRVDQSLYLWNRSALANYILRTLGDGTEMAHSVEGRLPFLDHALFEWVRALPLSLKIHNGTEKYLLREAMRPLVSETIYRRRKHPFLAPPVCRFSTPQLDGRCQDLLRGPGLAAVPFFDRRKVEGWLDRLPRMSAAERAAADPVLMTLLCACALQERFRLAA